jgi:hypothetical protein
MRQSEARSLSILPKNVRRWRDRRSLDVAAQVRAEAERERFFMMFPPVMFAFGLADESLGASESVWGDFFQLVLVGGLYWSIFAVIWRRIWAGRLPRRLPYWRTFVIGMLAGLLGGAFFPMLEAVGAPRF